MTRKDDKAVGDTSVHMFTVLYTSVIPPRHHISFRYDMTELCAMGLGYADFGCETLLMCRVAAVANSSVFI